MIALGSHEQRDDTIAIPAVVAHPLCHHTIEPHPEPLFPLHQVGFHPIGKVAYMVMPVPFVRKIEEIVFHGVNHTYVRRVKINNDILRSGFDTGESGFE